MDSLNGSTDSESSLPRSLPRNASGLYEWLGAGHLNEVRNSFQSLHRRWDKGRRTTVCLVSNFSFIRTGCDDGRFKACSIGYIFT
jgi:hypothetical protein